MHPPPSCTSFTATLFDSAVGRVLFTDCFGSVQPQVHWGDEKKAFLDKILSPSPGRYTPTPSITYPGSVVFDRKTDPEQTPPSVPPIRSEPVSLYGLAHSRLSRLVELLLAAPAQLDPADNCTHCRSRGGCSIKYAHSLDPCPCPNDGRFKEQTTPNAMHSKWCFECRQYCHRCPGPS
ncbi:hypothetical protein DFH07DRAFT_854459 [Mycena maculata]|uniref:Uncharacterized protein n=1 Tax=Mycena maculata TaxID=230809 RepID=A0AAD7HNV9_9AGAR|nr:hypothetical protein DFH07DRAFT_854459 [Mycena maculata]